MKKTLAIGAAAIVAALSLTACSTGTTSTPSATDTPTAAAPLDREGSSSFGTESLSDNASLTRGESEFILAIEDYDGIDYTASEEADIVVGGTTICYDLANGVHPLDIAFDLTETLGFTEFEGGFAVGLAANTICPEFSDLVDDAANEALSGGYNPAV